MEKISEQELIAMCLLQIEEKLDWGSSNDWHNDVFLELSETIQKQTNILLSPTTLKRVWGKVNYKSSPSINTLNTLAQSAGYLNWRDFKIKAGQKPTRSKKKKSKTYSAKGLILIAIVIMLLTTLFFAMKTDHSKVDDVDFSLIKFTSRPIAKGLPNSVVFDVDLKGLTSDSIYIQQFWDETKTIKLKPNQVQATGQYYFPGYFRAKLLVEGEIKKEHDLFIKSGGWLGTIDFEPIPRYYDESRVIQNNLVLPEEALKEISSSEQPLVSSFHYIDDFGEISGDNFLLKTAFKNVYNDKWAVCSITRIVVLGTEGAMIIPFSIPGCVSEIGLLLNDVYLSGKEHDLSAFGTDLSQFRDFEINVENKKVKVLIDGKSIYTSSYNATIGNIIGVRYRFLGAGEVEYLKLENLNNNLIINETF